MFWGVVINRFLLISVDSTGDAYFIAGMARNLLTYEENVSFEANASVCIPSSHFL